MGIGVGFSLSRKIAHLTDDEAVAKMGHPILVLGQILGHLPLNF